MNGPRRWGLRLRHRAAATAAGTVLDGGEVNRSKLVRLTRKLSWGLSDQALSSGTNFALSALIARSVSPAEFGLYSIAFAIYLIALNVSNGLTNDPLTVRFSHVGSHRQHVAISAAGGAALVIGVVFGVGCLAAATLLSGPAQLTLLALGIGLPGLLLQDAWRHAFFIADRGRDAFINDLYWTLIQVSAYAGLILSGNATLLNLMLAWGLAATAAAALGAYQLRLLPGVSLTWLWLRTQRDLAVRYLAEDLTLPGAGALQAWGLGAFGGLTAVGAFRGAELLVLGPMNVAFRGLQLIAQPEASRVLRQSVHRLARSAFVYGGARTLIALAWGGLVLLVPSSVGTALMGEVWLVAHPLLLPLTMSTALIGLTGGAEMGLRALGAAKRSLRARLVTAALTVAGVAGGAMVGGGLGAAWGYAIANTLAWVHWRHELRRGLRDWEHLEHAMADEAGRATPRVVGDFVYEPPWQQPTIGQPPGTGRAANQNGSAQRMPT